MGRDRSLRSQALDLLRFPLALVIVFIHVCATRTVMAGDVSVNVNAMAGASVFFKIIDAFLREQSVPIYFFISGYVFFLGVDFTIKTYGKKLSNRVHSLLIPYLVWNLIAVGLDFMMFIPSLHEIFPQADGFHFNLSLTGFLEVFWNGWYGMVERNAAEPALASTYPADYPLWFVRDLMLIVIATPLIYLLLKRSGRLFVGICGVVWVFATCFKLGHPAQISTGVFFFSWGAYMSYHKRDMIADFSRYFRYALPAYIALALLHIACSYLYPDALRPVKCATVFAGMIMAYGLSARIITRRGVKPSPMLAAVSFFIYAGHGVFVDYLNIFLFMAIRPSSIITVISLYLLSTALCAGLLIGLFLLLGRYLRPVQKLLAGRAYPPEISR